MTLFLKRTILTNRNFTSHFILFYVIWPKIIFWSGIASKIFYNRKQHFKVNIS